MRPGAIRVGVWPFWLAGSLYAVAAGFAGRDGGAPLAENATYYVVARSHYEMSLGAVFLLFAGVYAAFDLVFPLSYSRVLGWVHVLAMIVGVLLISLPSALLRLAQAPLRGADPTAIFATFNAFSTVGYVFTLLGIVAFVLLLLDVLRRWVDLHRPRWSQR